MAQDEKRKQEIKGYRRHNAHIDSGDRLSVILQKSLPSLRRRLRRSRHIFRDRRLGDLKAKHQKFAMDPGRSPVCTENLNPDAVVEVRPGPRVNL
jgi:hypothetical protein